MSKRRYSKRRYSVRVFKNDTYLMDVSVDFEDTPAGREAFDCWRFEFVVGKGGNESVAHSHKFAERPVDDPTLDRTELIDGDWFVKGSKRDEGHSVLITPSDECLEHFPKPESKPKESKAKPLWTDLF